MNDRGVPKIKFGNLLADVEPKKGLLIGERDFLKMPETANVENLLVPANPMIAATVAGGDVAFA